MIAVAMREPESLVTDPAGRPAADLVAAARAAWPALTLDPEAFLHTLVRSATQHGVAPAKLHAADLYLAQACAAGDPEAIAIFDRDWLARVPQFLTRHPAIGHADEVRQQLRVRLLVPADGREPRIATYSGHSPLSGWLRVVTLRQASNLLRGTRREAALPDGLEQRTTETPELRVLDASYHQAFRGAFRRAFAGLAAPQRMILKLHHIDGVTVRKLAPILDVSAATAGRRLLAAQAALRGRVLEEMSTAVAVPERELASVVRALVGRLEISMSALHSQSR